MKDIYDLVSREAIKEYKDMVLLWNKTINLVSSNDANDFFLRHFVDSLQLMHFIDNSDISIVDLGSGAGLPGIVLSLAGVKNVTLIESDSRKAAFLLQASKISSNKVEIINDRIENISGLECDILTSRALADLSSIFEYSRNISIKNKYLLHKGSSYNREISNARKHWLFKSTVHDSITSNNARVLEITDVEYIK